MPEWLRLELKMARVYNMLQDPENSAKHYTTVYESSDSLLDVDDACTYIDALRLLDRTQQAEVVARHYASAVRTARNQRFLNTLYALSNQQHYYNKGEADYAVRLLAGSTAAEYWLGEWDGRIFCAASQSRMLDPRKVFFHRTEYFSIGGDGELEAPARPAPRGAERGRRVRKATCGWSRASTTAGRTASTAWMSRNCSAPSFSHTVYNARRGGWSALQPLFEHQEEACYAQPGAAGTEDARCCSPPIWKAATEAGTSTSPTGTSRPNAGPTPKNLGLDGQHRRRRDNSPRSSKTNSTSPSNGQEGYGGYDIYRANLRRGQEHVQLAVASSLPDQLRVQRLRDDVP